MIADHPVQVRFLLGAQKYTEECLEWFIGQLSKSLGDASLTGVQIPPPPPGLHSLMDRIMVSGTIDTSSILVGGTYE